MKGNEFKWLISLPLNNMEVGTAIEKIILQIARESKTINYLVQGPETLGGCFDNLNPALLSFTRPIFQLALLHFLLSCYFTSKICSFLESSSLLTLRLSTIWIFTQQCDTEITLMVKINLKCLEDTSGGVFKNLTTILGISKTRVNDYTPSCCVFW